MKPTPPISRITIAIITAIMTLVASNLYWGKDHWTVLLESDAKGYFGYLPAVFIYNDLNFGFFDEIEKEKYYHKNLYYDYLSFAEGKVINKYYCGTALVEAPFYLGAHALSALFDYDTDGHSKLYVLSVSVAALFYFLAGLLYLNALLKRYQFNEWQRSLTFLALVFGTNLFYYAVCEPGLSHIFSFAFISMFLFHAKRFFSALQRKDILYMALALGIITLIRPINGLIVLALPFVAGSFSALKNGLATLLQRKLHLAYSIGIFTAIVSIQLIIYKIATGSFFVYSYAQEGFDFLDPHFIDILFSYRKGLFLYTPMYLLSLSGGYFLWRSSKFQLFAWFAFMTLITYIFSSWWMWYYGGSFSSRVYVEYLPLFSILLALPLREIRAKLPHRIYVSSIVLLILVCQVQTFQYRYYQIHWADMTKEKYWDVFLRVDKLIK